MANVLAFEGLVPVVHESAFIHPNAAGTGNPARVVKPVSDAMLAWKAEGTRLYQSLPRRLHQSLRACEPLRELPPDRPAPQPASYQTWHEARPAADGE